MPDFATHSSSSEPFLQPKELIDALPEHGIRGYNLRACQSLTRAMRADGAPVVRRREVRASDAAAWLLAHPDWVPFGRYGQHAGVFSV